MDNKIEKLLYAFEDIRSVKSEIEETGKNKRVVKHLDNVLGELENTIFNLRRLQDESSR